MANEKVTQMVELTAGEVAANDLFLIVDTSAKESKKLQASSFVSYFISSASFNANSASVADTASYVYPGNVGLIASSSFAINSTSASYAVYSENGLSSSHALVADSVAGTITNSDTASYLRYNGVDNGSASFSLTSSFTRNALSSAFLIYTGNPNGTASWAMNAVTTSNANTASWADFAMTASYLNTIGASVISASHANYADITSQSLSANTSSWSDSSSFLMYYPGSNNGTSSNAALARNATTASYVSNDSPNAVKAWATIIWIGGYASPIVARSHNISSIAYLRQQATVDNYWYQYKVVFENAINSENYMLIGNVDKMMGTAGNPSIGSVIIMETASNGPQPRYTTGFTMSMGITGSEAATWFSANGDTTWYADHTGSCRFMILGV